MFEAADRKAKAGFRYTVSHNFACDQAAVAVRLLKLFGFRNQLSRCVPLRAPHHLGGFAMSFLRPFIGLLVLILGLALAQPSFGQTFGEITGVVTDSTGGVVLNATVTVVNPQTNATRTATTNASGNYAFPALLPGI